MRVKRRLKEDRISIHYVYELRSRIFAFICPPYFVVKSSNSYRLSQLGDICIGRSHHRDPPLTDKAYFIERLHQLLER